MNVGKKTSRCSSFSTTWAWNSRRRHPTPVGWHALLMRRGKQVAVKRFLLSSGILFSLVSQPASAQLPAQHFISVRHDNDYLNLAGKGTDEYYTSDLHVQYSWLSRSGRSILDKVLISP